MPTNPYGESKLTFERVLRWYDQAYGLRYVSLRYFNAAGATARNGEDHDPETHLIPNVLKVAQGAKPLVEVFGSDYPTADGTCVRDYIHVFDLARAHVLSLNRAAEHSDIFNLGCGGNGYSVNEVIETARLVTSHEIPVRVAKRRPGDPAVLCAASDRIQSELGWRPSTPDLIDIIASAWQWMQSRSRSDEETLVLAPCADASPASLS